MKEYKIGDYLVHETNGVCTVKDIKEMALSGRGSEKLYYILSPVYSSKSQVVTPVQSDKVRVRDVKPKEELEKLYSVVLDLDTIEVDNDRKRGEVYKEKIACFEPIELARIVKTVYKRRLYRIKDGKKVMAQDEKMLEIAGKKLFEEMAFSFDEDVDEVKTKFLSQIKID
ncbi:MAG: hypothetical protein K5644_03745 [Lachnospiraceae bacterium]|nr:hypothetical protein [Lachnospiraceae bacterium]